jgi:hypothetical protein
LLDGILCTWCFQILFRKVTNKIKWDDCF